MKKYKTGYGEVKLVLLKQEYQEKKTSSEGRSAVFRSVQKKNPFSFDASFVSVS